MKFFKPDDYACLFGDKHFEARLKHATALCEIANKKLEKEGKVVYNTYGVYPGWFELNSGYTTTHKALLINIQKIKEFCAHPSDKISYSHGNIYKCVCGANLVPECWKEI